jgi:hypothetical protein
MFSSSFIPLLQPQRQHQQTHIRRHTQRRQHNHHIPTRPKLLPPKSLITDLCKELLIPLLSPICTHQQYSCPIHRKQCPNAVEFACEDFEDDERERELRERSAHVRALEGALRGADLDEFGGRELDAAGAVEAQAELVFGVATLEVC